MNFNSKIKEFTTNKEKKSLIIAWRENNDLHNLFRIFNARKKIELADVAGVTKIQRQGPRHIIFSRNFAHEFMAPFALSI